LETNRISSTAGSYLLAAIISATSLSAQVAPPDSVQKILPPAGDTLAVSQSQIDESQIPSNDTLFPAISIPESLVAETLSTEIAPTIFHDRIYLSKGPADEIKSIAGIFMRSPGPVGSPAIPLEYLNVSDLEIKLNGLPFPYQGLYRPYVIGTDINTIPWEILNSIEWNPRNGYIDGLDFQVGRPADNSNRSDIVIDRGGYRYDALTGDFSDRLATKLTLISQSVLRNRVVIFPTPITTRSMLQAECRERLEMASFRWISGSTKPKPNKIHSII